jgi:predicted dehydrogenase
MNERTLRAGVVGCGQIARKLHIPGYLRAPEVRLVALYNHRLETVEDLRHDHPQAALYDDYEEFLDESEVEAISVCTPNVFHAEMSVAALERGVHVLVEKPMATSLADARRMIDAAEGSGVLLMVGHTQRFYPCYRRAHEIIRSGALGRILQLQGTLAHGGPLGWSPRGHWFTTSSLAGFGATGDLGVHTADMMRFLTGQEIRSVAGFVERFELEEVEDNSAAVLQLSSGALGLLSVSWTTTGGAVDEFSVIGEEGLLRIGMEADSPVVLYTASGERVAHDVPRGIPKRGDAFLLDEISQFAQAALGKRPNPVTGEDGYRALEICVGIIRSSRERAVIELPLAEG